MRIVCRSMNDKHVENDAIAHTLCKRGTDRGLQIRISRQESVKHKTCEVMKFGSREWHNLCSFKDVAEANEHIPDRFVRHQILKVRQIESTYR